ncbi:ABC-2 type transport system permease protein [Paenibacillus endophyticus]|uniref:ABC-2 type transport system permease protein n=1 Tax=Paenibacillus endophyticus TaxID=1294268 RepID=A0A7W5C721_9BACL|nr:ABC transporter permease [Paenibacillus endophyticus]MBB3152278.1 ABC-2 type transport system permease protein [Paenibacillus endophyticus]
MPSLHIAAHLIRRTMGSRRGLIMNVLLPAIILSMMGGLLSGLLDSKPVIVVNIADRGSLGAYLASTLEKEPLYAIQKHSNLTEEELKALVSDGEADAAVYVPADFTSQMLSGTHSKAIVYQMNEQLWNASLSAMLAVESDRLYATVELMRGNEAYAAEPSRLAALLEAQAAPTITAIQSEMKLGQVVSNPMMIGLILMFLLLLVSQSIGFVMEDRDTRTMARMYTAPLRAFDIAFGNFMGSMLVGTIQLLIVLSLLYYAFGYSLGIPFGSLLLVLECYLLAAVGLTSAIAGLVRSSTQLSQINNLLIIPSCLISGCFFPLSIMPDFMQKLANFTPQKWAIQAIDRLGGGYSFSDIGMQLLILLLFAAVLITFGSVVLRPNRTS